MSEDNQENGASNGDVPEIELIIKDENSSIPDSESEDTSISTEQLEQSSAIDIEETTLVTEEYVIFELKSDADGTPTYSYVITNSEEIPAVNTLSSPENTNIETVVPTVIANPGPYVISVDIPIEVQPTDVCKENSPKTKRALARKRIPEAVDAVVKNGMTIGKAAKVFGVTKSTLWKEVNKQTDERKKKIDKDLNKKISDRICSGEPLSEISRSLNVAKSTIHLHKVRLAQKGKLPQNVTFKPPVDKVAQLAIKDRIIEAFRGVRVNGMSLRLASKFFDVPRSTLWTYIRRFRALQMEKDRNDNEETSEENNDEESCEDEIVIDNVLEDQQSTRSEGVNQEDFDLLDAYCEQQGNNDEGDFLISFDFETFEQYVKREFETT